MVNKPTQTSPKKNDIFRTAGDSQKRTNRETGTTAESKESQRAGVLLPHAIFIDTWSMTVEIFETSLKKNTFCNAAKITRQTKQQPQHQLLHFRSIS
ncbi:hypothetical protein CDAR_123301 [Caerostris darwini]|uniref:Uncharacterized protein n=1 Tax=Caerostris darwini TaxID=1538125 RepID=A0AAV4QDC4_9ARAC|nr:hypothetical protein CDAR_123301 [Caerostris darwini]